MNLKYKAIAVTTLVCAFSVVLFGSTFVSSAPRTGAGPLGTETGYVSSLMAAPLYSVTVDIPIQGYRQVTILISGNVGGGVPLGATADVTVLTAIPVAGGSWYYETDELTWQLGIGMYRTYQVEGSTLRVLVRNPSTTLTFNYTVGWYLTA